MPSYQGKTFDLFGSKWRIKFKDEVSIEDENGETVGLYGLTDYHDKVIEIDSSRSPEEIQLTLLHELIHASLSAGQYNDLTSNEPLVEWLARCINHFIKKGII